MNKEEIKSILLSIWAIGITGEPAESAGRLIATYIDQERERCAKIADNYTDYWPKHGVTWGDDPDQVAATCIAVAIRAGNNSAFDPPQTDAMIEARKKS